MREVNLFMLVTVSFWLYTVDNTRPLGKISEWWNDQNSKRMYVKDFV